MSLEAIYYIGQTIAVIAILVSLIFVGIQMRDGNRLARAQMHQQIADSFTEVAAVMIDENADFYEALYSPKIYQSLTRENFEKFNARMLALWKHYENVFYQYKNGFVAEEYWQSTAQYMALLVSRGGIRFWWEGRKQTFAAEFITFVDGLVTPAMPLDMKSHSVSTPDNDGADA